MINFQVKHDIPKLQAQLDALTRKHVPDAFIVALNRTAYDVVFSLKRQMREVFDRPTSFALRSFYVDSAKSSRPIAYVRPKDEAGKGTRAVNYMHPGIYGGDRRGKRHEILLRRRGYLGGERFTTPGPGATLNAYGNISASTYVGILSKLGAFPESGSTMNVSEESRKRSRFKRQAQYFGIPDGREKGLRPGVYKRVGKGITRVLNFIASPTYSPRLLFGQIGKRVSDLRFTPNFNKALGDVVARALRRAA